MPMRKPVLVFLILFAAAVATTILIMRSHSDRLSYAESCRFLQDAGLMEAGVIPPMPARAPRYDDEVLGVSFFRTELAEAGLGKLTLPRTFFGRSEVRAVTFRGTDLSESTMCWNDFVDVKFDDANLRGADLRASNFERVVFDGADLSGADLRHTAFIDCSWKGAILKNAKMTKAGARAIELSPDQRKQLDLHDDDGAEPDGG